MLSQVHNDESLQPGDDNGYTANC